MGGVGTVWQGSAFKCPSSKNKIVLRHGRYNGTYISIYCNNEGVTIVGQIVGVRENTYTSQVTISDSASKSGLIGKTVECVHDNGATAEIVMSYNITEIFVNDTSKYNIDFVPLVFSVCNF